MMLFSISTLFMAVIAVGSHVIANAKRIPVTKESLKEHGFKVEGEGIEEFFKAVEDGSIRAYLTDESLFSEETTIKEISDSMAGVVPLSDMTNKVDKKDGGVRALQPFNCPDCPASGVTGGPAYANDPVLTVKGQLFGFDFCIRFSCLEDCCVREWECTEDFCYLRCQSNTYVGFGIQIFPFGYVCCELEGRIVFPFPNGECLDAFLCAAT